MKIPAYKVRAFVIDKLTIYHVVNIETNVTHSQWRSLQIAMGAMRDLNRTVG